MGSDSHRCIVGIMAWPVERPRFRLEVRVLPASRAGRSAAPTLSERPAGGVDSAGGLAANTVRRLRCPMPVATFCAGSSHREPWLRSSRGGSSMLMCASLWLRPLLRPLGVVTVRGDVRASAACCGGSTAAEATGTAACSGATAGAFGDARSSGGLAGLCCGRRKVEALAGCLAGEDPGTAALAAGAPAPGSAALAGDFAAACCAAPLPGDASAGSTGALPGD
mmetsp:Transcript_1746/g.5367  ORF Transcript_1746/g.5367 Transcript_1746/m.5367 type:complete len:223 (-) Transcript_1746:1735-2403(-)